MVCAEEKEYPDELILRKTGSVHSTYPFPHSGEDTVYVRKDFAIHREEKLLSYCIRYLSDGLFEADNDISDVIYKMANMEKLI